MQKHSKKRPGAASGGTAIEFKAHGPGRPICAKLHAPSIWPIMTLYCMRMKFHALSRKTKLEGVHEHD